MTPASVTARPDRRHAVCGYVWQRAIAILSDGVPACEVTTLCGGTMVLPSAAVAEQCARCRLVAAGHHMNCDCHSMWKESGRGR